MSANRKKLPWKTVSIVLALVCLAMCGLLISLLGNSMKAEQANKGEVETAITAYVSGLVTNSNGEPLISSVEIINTSTSEIIRNQTNLLGRYEVLLPVGNYEFIFSKGFEYERKSIPVEVENRLRVSMNKVVLERIVDWSAMGWYPGDLHQHTTYSDGYQNVDDVLISNLANGLDWGVLSDHNTVDGNTEWLQAGRLFSDGAGLHFVSIPGMEVTTEKGHYNSLGSDSLVDHSVLRDGEDIKRIADEIRTSGALAQVNHPFLTDGMGFEHWDLIQNFDTFEIWNGKGVTNDEANLQAKEKWFELLNNGIYLPATGGSDNHDITGLYPWRRENESDACKLWIERGLYSGMPRNYVYLLEDFSSKAVMLAVKEGRLFITNGPLINFELEGVTSGHHIKFDGECELSIRLYDQRGLESAVLIENGVKIREFDVKGKNEVSITDTVSVTSGSWYVLEVTGSEGGYAITNPIFVD